MLGEMLNLEKNHSMIYQEYVAGNVSVQLSTRNTFGRIEADKVIETTINKDTKTPGGLKGFSTNVNTVDRWILNATHRASLRKCFHQILNYKGSKSNIHNDLSKSRIKKDNEDVKDIIEVLKENFIHPFSNRELVCISNGLVAPEDVSENFLNAKMHGAKLMKQFMSDRLEEGATIDFYQPMKKKGLKTFTHMRKVVKVSVKDRMIPLKAIVSCRCILRYMLFYIFCSIFNVLSNDTKLDHVFRL